MRIQQPRPEESEGGTRARLLWPCRKGVQENGWVIRKGYDSGVQRLGSRCGDFALSQKAALHQEWRIGIGHRAEPQGICCSQRQSWGTERRSLMAILEKNTVSLERMSRNESHSHQEVTLGRPHSTHAPSSHFPFLSA